MIDQSKKTAYKVPLEKEIHYPSPEIIKRYETAIEDLFENARKIDEAEVISAVLYFTGTLFYYDRDAVKELGETIEEFMSLLQRKDEIGIGDRTFFKLFSYLYIHITELEEFYVLLFNLLSIPQGNYYELTPFKIKDKDRMKNKEFLEEVDKLINGKKTEDAKVQIITELVNKQIKKEQPVWAKLKIIEKQAVRSGNTEISKILHEIYDNKLRNAFSHNEYRFSSTGIHYGEKHLTHLTFEDLLKRFVNALLFASILADKAFDELKKIKDAGGKVYNCQHGTLEVGLIIEKDGYRWNIQSKRLTPYI